MRNFRNIDMLCLDTVCRCGVPRNEGRSRDQKKCVSILQAQRLGPPSGKLTLRAGTGWPGGPCFIFSTPLGPYELAVETSKITGDFSPIKILGGPGVGM